MYKAVKIFVDMQDYGFLYNIGDSFPRQGLEVSEARIAELASCSNRLGEPLIAKVKPKKAKKKEETKD